LFVAGYPAPVFGFVFRPKVGRDYRQGNPAQTQGEVMQPFQKIDDGHFAVFEHGKKIVGGRFQQFFISQGVIAG
jgi:hypothetical protein